MMIRPGTEDEMVDILSYRTPEGRVLLTVRATRTNRDWLRALFAHNLTPFRALRDIGFEAMSPDNARAEIS